MYSVQYTSGPFFAMWPHRAANFMGRQFLHIKLYQETCARNLKLKIFNELYCLITSSQHSLFISGYPRSTTNIILPTYN